jgi:galactonate dehydratase
MPQNLSADSLGFDYLAEEDVIRSPGGRLERPTKPGLGIEIDEEQLRIHQHENASWTKPIVSHPDGSVAER